MATFGDFLTEHRDRLRALFEVLCETYLDDDDALVAWMESRWLGSEHGAREGKATYTAEQGAAALPLLRELGLIDRVEPSREAYDEVVVLGAAGIGLHRRLGLVRDTGARAPVLSVLAGQRPHEGRDRDGGIDELLATDGRFAASEGWQPPLHLVQLAEELAEGGVDPLRSARALVPTETDLARLLVHKRWPGLSLRELVVGPPQEIVNELGPRLVAWERYDVPDPTGPIDSVNLLNGAPAQRHDSDSNELPSRPTTRSTLAEWVTDARERAPRSVLFVVNQPHLSRVAPAIEEALAALSVDAEAEIVGCEVLTDQLDPLLVLGEIPARINVDRQRR